MLFSTNISMNKLFKNKIFVFFALFAVSVLAWAAAKSVDALNGKTPSKDNITVIRKQVYTYPEGGKDLLEHQWICNGLKKASYEQFKTAKFAPLPEDVSTLEDVRKLQNITITEYYSGTNYARYEEGFEYSLANPETSIGDKDGASSKFNCGLQPTLHRAVFIETPKQSINIQEVNGKSKVVKIRNKSQTSLDGYGPSTRLDKNLAVYKLPSTMQECLAGDECGGSCYFKDIPIHPGTDRKVEVADVMFKTGKCSMIENSTNTRMTPFDTELGPVLARHMAKSTENVSIQVGKAISASIFEIPEYAKNYPVKSK